MTDTLTPPSRGAPPGPQPDEWVPVEHRIAGLDRRTLPAAIGVLVLAFVYVWLLPAIDQMVENDDAVVAGEVFTLGGGITFVPSVGWQVDDGVRVADGVDLGPGRGTAALTDGAVQFRALTGNFEGTPDELLDQINETNEALDDEQGFHVTSDTVTVTTDQGLTGVRETYTGTAGTGIIAAFVIDVGGTSVGVELTATAPELELVDHVEEIDGMIDSLSYEPVEEEQS